MRGTIFAAMLSLLPGAALAGFEICNDTPAPLRVAIATDAGDQTLTKGWWTLPPERCEILEPDPRANRYWYWHAEGLEYTFFGLSRTLCTGADPFEILDQTTCADGAEARVFHQIDTGYGVAQMVLILSPTYPAVTGQVFREGAPRPAPQLGPPITLTGRLSHCDIFDTGFACELHQDGQRYLATSTDGTSPRLVDEMLEMPENTPLSARGAVYERVGARSMVVLDQITPLDPDTDPWADARYALQGRWAGPDGFDIRGGLITRQADGAIYVMDLATACPGQAGDGRAVMIWSPESGDAEPDCYAFTITDTRLTLDPMDGSAPRRFDRAN